MRTKDVASTLRGFAVAVDVTRSEELFKLAIFLEKGGTETIFPRLKRLSPSTSYPPRLKESLESIRAVLQAAGARKQANVFSALLQYFKGRPTAQVDSFLQQLLSSPTKPIVSPPRLRNVDHQLVTRILDQLQRAVLDNDLLQRTLAELNSPRLVPTHALALIANKFVQNGPAYRDRKTALNAIVRATVAAGPGR